MQAPFEAKARCTVAPVDTFWKAKGLPGLIAQTEIDPLHAWRSLEIEEIDKLTLLGS